MINKNMANLLEIGAENYISSGIRLWLHLEGETINEVETYVGYSHKGLEKLFEHKKYQLIIDDFAKIDDKTPFALEYPFVLAYEKLNNIEVPKRASYIRIIHAEIARIVNHISNIGFMANAVGMSNVLTLSIKIRKYLLEIYEKTLKTTPQSRVFEFGGVKYDLNDEYVEGIKLFFCNMLYDFIKELDNLMSGSYAFKLRTKDVGYISNDNAIYYGLSGANLRASGEVWDLRCKEPYSLYSDFDFDIPICETGDCYARYLTRIEEVKQSIAIVMQAFVKLPSGDIKNNDIDAASLVAGEAFSTVESPKGELGVYLLSDGSFKPYRCNIRTPSLAHTQALNFMLKGALLSDVPLIVASLDISAANVDK